MYRLLISNAVDNARPFGASWQLRRDEQLLHIETDPRMDLSAADKARLTQSDDSQYPESI